VPWPGYAAWARENTFICATVETEEGIRNFDEIIAVEGVNAVGIGTFDLSVAMGFGGDYQHPKVVAKAAELSAAARARGLEIFGAVIEYSNLASELERLKSADARLVMYPGDRFLLSSIYKRAVASLSSWAGVE
jgi:4-hydroxy-2-oxoheptanedioate aldolase